MHNRETEKDGQMESGAPWPRIYVMVVVFTVIVISGLGLFSWYFSH